MMDILKIEHSDGRAKQGRSFTYVRPAGMCANKSRRVAIDRLWEMLEEHFPNVNYYQVDGHIIGAKNEEFALREYWRICEKSKIGKWFEVALLI